jgi:hypothetical protein
VATRLNNYIGPVDKCEAEEREERGAGEHSHSRPI